MAGVIPLERGESGKRWRRRQTFLLEEDAEGFAEGFGVDEVFQEEAGAEAVGFGLAVVVEVGEVVGAAEDEQEVRLEVRPARIRPA